MSIEPATTPTPPWDEQLLALLERQQDLVVELGRLAERQGALIEDRRTDALLGLLAERQRIIDQFTDTQASLGHLTEDLGPRLERTEPDRAERIRTLLDEIGSRLAEVMQRDEHDQALLQTGRAAVREEMASLDTGAQARSAYLKPKPAAKKRGLFS